jgi:hypothetical protein
VASIRARAVAPRPGQYAGLTIRLDGAAPQDRTPIDDPATNPLSSGVPNFNFYTMEVVQRIGYDSFVPDQGVLIAKNKDRSSNTGGPNGVNVFAWTIDAHPEDINKVDFRRPNGEPVMRSIADYRQLNDALFHAGQRSGSKFEWEDTANRLHFYVINGGIEGGIRDLSSGIMSYSVAVRSLDGSGPHIRGVKLTADSVERDGPRYNAVFIVENTGSTAPVSDSIHPRARPEVFNNDLFRFTATVEGSGWSVDTDYPFYAMPPGLTLPYAVAARHNNSASATAKITLRAVSESDPSKSATATITVRR